MPATIAHRPEPPRFNPPGGVTINSQASGRLLRLECPEELGGEWDGPIYVLLQGRPIRIQPTDTSEFILDYGQRVPGWECKLVLTWPGQDVSAMPTHLRVRVDEIVRIPLWRLTHIGEDLVTELDERPLLSVFRFVRFSRYFARSPDDDKKLVLQTPGATFCGQVLTYRLAAPFQLVDEQNIIIEPRSQYLCIVAIRRHVSECHLVVAIPLPEIREQFIPQAEFILGYAHTQAKERTPGVFATGWTSFKSTRLTGTNAVRDALMTAFPSTCANPVPGTRFCLDLGNKPVWYVSPQGAVRHVVPVKYAHSALVTATSTVDVDTANDGIEPAPLRAPLGGPLLENRAVELTALNDDGLVAVYNGQPALEVVMNVPSAPTEPDPAPTAVGATAPPPAPGADAPAGNAPGAPSGIQSSDVPEGLSPSERMLFAMLQEQRAEHSRAQLAAARQLEMTNNQMNQFATAIANIQQQFTALIPQLPPPPPVPQLAAPRDQPVPGTIDRDRHGHRARSPRAPERRGAAYDADFDDVDNERARLDHARLAHRGRSASPGARSRGRSRDRSHSRSRDRSRPRSRSRDHRRERSPRARFADRSERSRSRSRSPRGHQPRGNDRFRPSPNEHRVHELARVGPRQGTMNPNLFYNAEPLDQVRTMLQVERFRRRYEATKVTTKMLYAVDFHSRPLDHFLSGADAHLATRRMVGPDSTQWGGAEPVPASTIRTADHLHRALYAIQDAASVWYPDDLARVFRAVHNNATQHVQQWATEHVINAMCNLYSAVFASVFGSILGGTPLHHLESQALQMLRRDSDQYQQYVGMVLSDAMMHSVFHGQPGRQRDPPPQRPRPERRAPRPPPGGQSNVIPPHLRDQIPRVDGVPVCLRYQTMKDCDFAKCRNAHDFAELPRPLLQWVVARHNSLKSDHPQC